MKNLLICIICLIISSCATTKQVDIDSAEFDTANYQANIDQLIASTNSLKDFNSEDKQEAKINIEDLSTLMQADVYFNQADYSNALPIYSLLANKYQIPLIIYKVILCYERLGTNNTQMAEVNKLIDLFIKVAPSTSVAKVLLIKVNLFKNNLNQAETTLNEVLKNKDLEQQRQILLFLSSTLTLYTIPDVSSNILNEFAKYTTDKYSNVPEAYLLASVCYSITNNKDDLKHNLAYINAVYSTWQIPLFWDTSILSNSGNYTTVIDVVKPMISGTTVTSPVIQNIYVGALLNNNQANVAESYLQAQLKLGNSSNAILNLGLIYTKEKKYTEALIFLTKVNTDNPTINNMVKMLIGLIYDTQNNYGMAATNYVQISGNVYLENVANVLAIYDYHELNASVKLDGVLSQIVTNRNLTGIDALLFKTKYYMSLSDYATAYLLLKSSYKQYRNNADYVYLYASVAALSNHTQEAIMLYKRYIKMSPESAYGYNDIAFTYADNTHDYAQALKYAKKAASININDENILDTLGWIYYKKGDYQTAYAYLSSSYQMGQSPDVAKHLKVVLLKLNKPELANQIIIVDKDKINLNLKVLLLDKMLNLLMLLQYGVTIK